MRSALDANIDLHAASKHGENGRESPPPTYYVNTSTSNSRMQTDFWHQPADSTLIYHGSTSNAFAQAQLHTAYQGDFEIQTSNANPVLQVKEEDPVDPSGRGRRRRVDTRSVGKGRVTGSVEWVGRNSGVGKGRVVLETSNSQAVLVL